MDLFQAQVFDRKARSHNRITFFYGVAQLGCSSTEHFSKDAFSARSTYFTAQNTILQDHLFPRKSFTNLVEELPRIPLLFHPYRTDLTELTWQFSLRMAAEQFSQCMATLPAHSKSS